MEPISLIFGGIKLFKSISKIKGLFGSKKNKVENAVSVLEDAMGELKGKELPPETQLEVMKATQEYEKDMRKIDTEQMGVVAKTMIEYDTKADKWYQKAWRPAWAFMSCGCFGYVIVVLIDTFKMAVKMNNPAVMNTMPQFVFNIFLLFTIPGAVMGVTAWGRNKLKQTREEKEKGLLSKLFG